jgi:hypothetical protein
MNSKKNAFFNSQGFFLYLAPHLWTKYEKNSKDVENNTSA